MEFKNIEHVEYKLVFFAIMSTNCKSNCYSMTLARKGYLQKQHSIKFGAVLRFKKGFTSVESWDELPVFLESVKSPRQDTSDMNTDHFVYSPHMKLPTQCYF